MIARIFPKGGPTIQTLLNQSAQIREVLDSAKIFLQIHSEMLIINSHLEEKEFLDKLTLVCNQSMRFMISGRTPGLNRI